MDSFYVVVPSNSPGEGNQTSNFTVRLPDSLELDSNWTVALSSIIYPNSFLKSISDEENYIIIHYVDTTKTPRKVTFPLQNYATVQSLEKGLKDTCAHLFGLIPQPKNVRKRRGAAEKREISPEYESPKTQQPREKSPEIEKIDNSSKEKSPETEPVQKQNTSNQHDRASEQPKTTVQNQTTTKSVQKTVQKEKSPEMEPIAEPKNDMRAPRKDISPELESSLLDSSTKTQENQSTDTQNEIANLQKRLNEEIDKVNLYRTFTLHQKIAQMPNPMALKLDSGPFEIHVENADEIYRELHKKFFIFEYQTIAHRFQLKIHNIYISHIEISQGLAYILGYDKNLIYRNNTAKYSPDPAGGIRELYIYAPKLIENTIVGNIKAPLLRITNIQGEWGETAECIYTLEQHHKLLCKRISEIQIEIRSFDGNLIKFNWGNCILILHFMRNLFLT